MAFRVVSILCAVALLSAACAATPGQPASDGDDLEYQLLRAELALAREAPDVAIDAYLKAMMMTRDAEIAERATRLALIEGREADAARAIARWHELDAGSLTLMEAEAVLALRRGDNDRALDRVERLLDSWRGEPGDEYRALGRLLLDESDRGAVVELLRRLAERRDEAAAWHILGMLALRAGEVDIARGAAIRVRELAPEWTQGVVLEARVLAHEDDIPRAIGMLESRVETQPDDATLRFALAGIQLAAGDDEGARKQLEEIIELEPTFTDARWTLGLLLLRGEEPDAAEAHLRELLIDPVRRPDASYFIAGAHEQREDWRGALEWFDRVEWGENLVNARIKAAHMLFKLDRITEGRYRLQRLRSAYPEERERLYRVEAHLLIGAEHERAALEIYDHALDEFTDHVPLRYARALLRDQAGDHEGAITDLRYLHAQEPDSPEVLNALGYVLADRGQPEDWPEARRLIRRALEHEPDNPAYIDSMGWVLYRLGELENAREWLERAWRSMPDGEVGAHLGEVLWKLGEKEAAKEVWMDAASRDPDHPVLQETMERLLP